MLKVLEQDFFVTKSIASSPQKETRISKTKLKIIIFSVQLDEGMEQTDNL